MKIEVFPQSQLKNKLICPWGGTTDCWETRFFFELENASTRNWLAYHINVCDDTQRNCQINAQTTEPASIERQWQVTKWFLCHQSISWDMQAEEHTELLKLAVQFEVRRLRVPTTWTPSRVAPMTCTHTEHPTTIFTEPTVWRAVVRGILHSRSSGSSRPCCFLWANVVFSPNTTRWLSQNTDAQPGHVSHEEHRWRAYKILLHATITFVLLLFWQFLYLAAKSHFGAESHPLPRNMTGCTKCTIKQWENKFIMWNNGSSSPRLTMSFDCSVAYQWSSIASDTTQLNHASAALPCTNTCVCVGAEPEFFSRVWWNVCHSDCTKLLRFAA